jgi:hypothetical protein
MFFSEKSDLLSLNIVEHNVNVVGSKDFEILVKTVRSFREFHGVKCLN